MKPKILLTVLLVVMIMGARAQKTTMTLTFTADDNGQYVPLNSILIENLTQGGDTTLYAPDTVLVLDYVTGMEEVSGFSGKGFFLFQNYPNPMEGKTTISLRLTENKNISITVSDIMGRELVHQDYQLERGSHSFTFLPGRESLYFLTALVDQQSNTIKMFNSPSIANGSGICKLKYKGQQSVIENYKSGNYQTNFVFNLGDQLKYTSSTALGERVITNSPTSDQTFYFHYTGNPCPDAPTVTDIDGNVYNTVQIGTQCWMKENLKTTTYRNGTAIPNITDDYAWSVLFSGAYAWYDNDISWKDSYGALYNWFATVDANGLCPTGWHVPTHDEWTALTDYIGGTSSPHGNELKSCRQVNSPLGGGCNTSEHPRWNELETHYGTDNYGFSGLPGGSRGDDGMFEDVGIFGLWWSSTEDSFNWARERGLGYFYGFVSVGLNDKQKGRSIRCLRD
ncbi:MAG: T9SS type A sorting domain-containing protein [Bacteroidales bacterium]|nr:T9SS type A sorting domain-containing protein [Bacteroidales bacterium]